MFEFYLRKTLMRDLTKEEQETAMLLKYKVKMQLLGQFLICILRTIPLASFITSIILGDHTVSSIIQYLILILAYCIFATWFKKRFEKQIEIFQELIISSLYTSRYILKGNALSIEDFETIKKEDKSLYDAIMLQKCRGYCYHVCFEMLKCVKKGTMLFVSTKSFEKEKKENGNMQYTMHVLYVNNDWCFDTYSQRQYPLEEVLKRMRTKTFASFDYNAIDGKTYEEFRAEHIEELKVWCGENNCYQEWLKEDKED